MSEIHNAVRRALEAHLKRQQAHNASNSGISSHFSRKAKIMVGLLLSVVLLGLLAAIVAPRITHFFAVDRCLDSGGSFNYNSNQCEGARESR